MEHEWREAGVLHDLDQFELTFLEEHTASEVSETVRNGGIKTILLRRDLVAAEKSPQKSSARLRR